MNRRRTVPPRRGRKIVVYVATSADGFIARPDGDVAWLDRPRTAGDYGMAAFFKSIDTVLMGRKTYDVALKFGQRSYPRVRNYIFSRSRHRSSTLGVEFVKEEVGAFARWLRGTEGKDVWMVGGGELIAAFLDEQQIDEFVIHVIPTFIGEGIPLVAPRHRDVSLRLRSARKYSDGAVRLRYDVAR